MSMCNLFIKMSQCSPKVSIYLCDMLRTIDVVYFFRAQLTSYSSLSGAYYKKIKYIRYCEININLFCHTRPKLIVSFARSDVELTLMTSKAPQTLFRFSLNIYWCLNMTNFVCKFGTFKKFSDSSQIRNSYVEILRTDSFITSPFNI